MDSEILGIFKNIYDKQDILGKINDKELFKELDISEVHCIDFIGSEEDINGIKVANAMGMTRGGASKLLNKLLLKGYLTKYKKDNNKKEIYFELTKLGKEIYDKHKIAHKKWEERELEFLDSIDKKDKEVVYVFLNRLNDYLEIQIEEGIND